MNETIIELKVIEQDYVNGKYQQAYTKLHCLCCEKEPCEQFSPAAMSILSRYSDLEKSIAEMKLDLGQQDQIKREICNAFTTLTIQMKRQFDSHSYSSVYEEESIRMKEQRNMLRKSQMKIEDDLTDCDNPGKAKLLKMILEQLSKMIDSFWNLMKKFQAMKKYE